MRKVLLAAAFVLAAISDLWAQDFNPGTVVLNVFQDPASGCGCGYGHGCCPPQSYAPGQYSHVYPFDRHKRVVRRSAATASGTNH
jgi:hypothetical protein